MDIVKLSIPSDSNPPASVQYLHSVYKLLVNLTKLEIAKGRPVPDLQSSNAFLSSLLETKLQQI